MPLAYSPEEQAANKLAGLCTFCGGEPYQISGMEAHELFCPKLKLIKIMKKWGEYVGNNPWPSWADDFIRRELMNDYKNAKQSNVEFDTNKRWEEGINHHPESVRLMKFLSDFDFKECGDFFCWKTGGDGDNGEQLMYEMDVYFEYRDTQPK